MMSSEPKENSAKSMANHLSNVLIGGLLTTLLILNIAGALDLLNIQNATPIFWICLSLSMVGTEFFIRWKADRRKKT